MNTYNFLSTSTLVGNDVKNTQGEDLGKVEDFVINTNDADVEYAVVSFGGFLGLGDKLFAVPLQAMELDRDDHCFRMHCDKEKLENAPGFDKDNWPNFADTRFREQIYGHYGVTV